jgi:hypothetical protein
VSSSIRSGRWCQACLAGRACDRSAPGTHTACKHASALIKASAYSEHAASLSTNLIEQARNSGASVGDLPPSARPAARETGSEGAAAPTPAQDDDGAAAAAAKTAAAAAAKREEEEKKKKEDEAKAVSVKCGVRRACGIERHALARRLTVLLDWCLCCRLWRQRRGAKRRRARDRRRRQRR